MNPLDKSRIGSNELDVTKLGLGGAGIGVLYKQITDAQGIATVRKAMDLGINYIDTAPLYSLGRSETLIGKALSGRQRDSIVISTKVGRLISRAAKTIIFDFTREAVLRSLEGSLERLDVESVDALFIHDPDNHYEMAISRAYPALRELRAQGIVKAIGVGMNQWEMELRFAKEGDFDCFLLAGRYTLLDQTALPKFMTFCQERGISIIIGSPYNSGILASNLGGEAKYNYKNAPGEILDKVRRINVVCQRHEVPLKAAALQFVLAHPAVVSVIPGSRSPNEVEENFKMMQYPIPERFWNDLQRDRLISRHAPIP